MENDIFYKFLVWIEVFNLFHVILTLYLKKKVKFQKKRHLFWENQKQIQIIEICCMPEIRKFGHISDFLSFYLSSKNSHQLGLNPPTDMFHHSLESWQQGEEDRTWARVLKAI